MVTLQPWKAIGCGCIPMCRTCWCKFLLVTVLVDPPVVVSTLISSCATKESSSNSWEAIKSGLNVTNSALSISSKDIFWSGVCGLGIISEVDVDGLLTFCGTLRVCAGNDWPRLVERASDSFCFFRSFGRPIYDLILASLRWPETLIMSLPANPL